MLVKSGRPKLVTMACGWGCGKTLTRREMYLHFGNCPRRPQEMVAENVHRPTGRRKPQLRRPTVPDHWEYCPCSYTSVAVAASKGWECCLEGIVRPWHSADRRCRCGFTDEVTAALSGFTCCLSSVGITARKGERWFPASRAEIRAARAARRQA